VLTFEEDSQGSFAPQRHRRIDARGVPGREAAANDVTATTIGTTSQ
jgi:hypothetical protein